MTRRLAHARRGERAFERLYRRHVGDVYRYVLLVLLDPPAAEKIAQATFLSAYRVREGSKEQGSSPHTWLLRLAHADCRRRVRRADLDEDAAPPRASLDSHCPNLRAVSRLVDGRTARSERTALRLHLQACDDCRDFARSHRAQRPAWSALGTLAVPASFGSFFGPGGVLASASESGGTVDAFTAAPTTLG
jgi:DNA-directed RNA polymerase specialized sigma24 family protein